MIKKYCPNKCRPEFDAKEICCPKCGTRLDIVRVDSKKDVNIKFDIKDKKISVDGVEMTYLGDENVDLSDPKYMLLTISKFKNDKRVIRGSITVVDPLDNLREYMCVISDTPNLQIRNRQVKKQDRPDLFNYYNAHITIPGIELGSLVVYEHRPVCLISELQYDKYISGDKIMIFIDPNNNTRFFLLYVKRDKQRE